MPLSSSHIPATRSPRFDQQSQSDAFVRSVRILDVKVGVMDRHSLVHHVEVLIQSKTKGWISYVNIDAVNQAVREPWLRDFINNSLFSYCDGMGVLAGARILGERIPERITLADCMDELCVTLEHMKARIFFLGASDTTVKRAVMALQLRFPGIDVCGSAHGYFDLSNGIDVQRQINSAKPDIVFVGMGMPRQEEWILKNSKNVDATLFWSAGALFEFLAGSRKRCPGWMARSGLEWVYRLAQEPVRLWRRYIIGNPLFMFRVLSSRLGKPTLGPQNSDL